MNQIPRFCVRSPYPVPEKAADQGIEKEFGRRLGHSNPHFPLAEHQRQVLAWLDAAKPGEVIVVNGPPGTGKTTLLLSVPWPGFGLKQRSTEVIRR
ncbi:hypothetical protein [Ponticoccus litoralis]|uniref:AAA domain-containing protein n=1 Tax=Ponticoccus litoralis TaxID=422297 RepID=A0AAW9SNN7_9RHOB